MSIITDEGNFDESFEFRRNLARRLKILRVERDMSREELAERAGVSYGQISAYETARSVPLLDTTFRLAKALGCTPNDICGFTSVAEEAL